jgi:S-adenosyl methyltransferase
VLSQYVRRDIRPERVGGAYALNSRPAYGAGLPAGRPAGWSESPADRGSAAGACPGWDNGGKQLSPPDLREPSTMADGPDDLPGEHPTFDTSVAHQARIYNYWLGGKDNYAADRKAAERVMQAYPDILIGVRAQRAFLGRAVRYLAGEAGVRQFLDIGTGIPTADNTHEVAQLVAPDSRVVYVDNDPTVLAHARALLTSSPEGATDYLDADVRDPETILREAARTLDFSQPVAVLLLGILHGIPDAADPWDLVARLLAAVPSGSYLVIAHPTIDITSDQMAEGQRRYNESAASPIKLRTRAEVARFFEGTDMVDPGLVQLHRWRPGPASPVPRHDVAAYGGVGRKS